MPRPVLRIILLLVAMLIPSTAGYAVASPGLSAPPSGAPPRVVTGPDPRPTAVSEHPLEDLVAAAPSARRQGAEDPPGPSATADTAGRSDRVGSLSTPFELVGARWPAGTTLDPSTVIEVRARVATGWSQWSRLSADDASPDPGDREGKAAGTSAEPVWFGDADAAEIRVSGAPAPRGLSVVAVHTTRAAADQVGRPGGAPAPGVGPRRSLATPDLLSQRPGWYSRAQWGADDALKPADCQAPRYTSTVKAVFVHHTAGVNGYAQADVPAILRGIYSYQLNNGWCDIAYNALVDRFGGIWEGRSGGLDQPVLSGATGGFNTNTWAISVLGNYQTASVSSATFWSLVTMISWELVLYGRDPVGTTTLTQSQGGTSVGAKWNDGDTVTLNVVNGHRDAVYTECPGDQLYALMDQLRASVNAQIGGSPIGNVDAASWSAGMLTLSGWTLDPGTVASIPVRLSVDGGLVSSPADLDRPDVAASYPLYGGRHGFSITLPRPVPPQRVCLTGVDVAGGQADGPLGCPDVAVMVKSASASGPVASVSVAGFGWGHGRGMGQWGAYGYATKYGWGAATILDHFYGGTSAATVSATSLMSVRLNRYDGTTPKVTSATPFVLSGVVIGANEAAWLTYADGTWTVHRATSCTTPPWYSGPASGVMFSPARPTSGPDSSVMLGVCEAEGIRHFRGDLGIAADSTGFVLVNYVGLDDYLRGVVPRESPSGWPAAALQAQAVAARSYAMSESRYAYAKTCDTTSCQVYSGAWFGGVRLETPDTDAAISATSGGVRRSSLSGAIARTEFSSSTGGYTAGGTFPAVIDDGDDVPGNVRHTWSGVTISSTQLSSAYPVGTVTDISVTQRNGYGAAGGRVTQVTIAGTGGSVTRTGSQFRTDWGLNSDWFTLQITRANALWGLSNGYGVAPSQVFEFGRGEDVPLMCDWTGTKPVATTFRAGLWTTTSDNANGAIVTQFGYGIPGDVPICGDWDGDGRDSVGIFRSGTWALRNGPGAGAPDSVFGYGIAGDLPIVGKWTGGDRDLPGIWRFGTWAPARGFGGEPLASFAYGYASDQPVVGSWSGSGVTAFGIRRGSLWALRDSWSAGSPTLVFGYGEDGDRPVTGDWDRNGSETPGIMR